MRVRRWAAAAGAALLWAVVLALPALVPGGGAGPAARASPPPAPRPRARGPASCSSWGPTF